MKTLVIILMVLFIAAIIAMFLRKDKRKYTPKTGGSESNPIKDKIKDKHQELN